MKGSSKYLRTIGLVLALFIVLIFPLYLNAIASKDLLGKRVLMISSYHPGFAAFFQQIDGARSVLEPRGVAMDVEFMDTKRFSDQTNLEMFQSYLSYKMKRLPPYDAVILADDSALRFAVERQNDLFKDIPVVFCGINDIKFALAQDENPWITGVVEDVSMRGTIELILRLSPSVREIVAISDGHPSGRADLKKFLSNRDIFPNIKLSAISLEELSWEEGAKRLREMRHPEAAALLLSAYFDKNGEIKSFEEGLAFVLGNLSAPLYHLWLHGIGQGIIGGRVISQSDQGKTAAQMVTRILEGTDVSQIPVLGESPNRHVLDYRQMERFSIPISAAPQGTEILYGPEPLFSCSKRQMIWGCAFAGVLVLTSLAAIFMLLRSKRAERALRESEKRYRALFDNVAEGILVVKKSNGTVGYANPAMAAMLGYALEDLRGKRAADIRPDGTVPPPANGEPSSTDFLRRDGSLLPSEEKWTGIQVGGEDYLLGIVHDVTQRRAMDEELERHRINLENLIVERTAELERKKGEAQFLAVKAQEEARRAHETLDRLAKSEKMLIEARDSANEANRAKSDFLATMSHEIRTPLNAVIGLSQLLLKEPMTDGQRDSIAKINGSALSLMGIIDDILDFSKIEAGRMDTEKIPFLLEEVLSGAVETVFPAAERKGIEIHVDKSPSLPPSLIGDPMRIRQILHNLLSNAVKFTESGDIVVSVTERGRGKHEIDADFSVEDSGIGMTEEEMARIFQPFVQADGSITRKYRGTGLGLTISKRLCELMGGSIRAKSAPGKGSRFDFSIPLGMVEGRENQELPASLCGSDLKILAVDDNPIARKILGRLLGSMGFEAEAVSCGKDALARLSAAEKQGRPFGMVLLDWMMPDMDGIETARKIGASGLSVMPKLLMVTAHKKAQVAREAEEAGFSSILTKPVQPSDLLNSILSALGKRGIKSCPQELGKGESTTNLKGARILLVEDDDINREVAGRFLINAGATVTEAANGRDALKKTEGQTFDLILMDIQMPDMDGFQVTSEIRKGEKNGVRTPIVAMTAHAMASDRSMCIEAGMDDHIPKPISPKALLSVISHWLPGDSIIRGEKTTPLMENPIPQELQVPGIDAMAGLHRTGEDLERYLAFLDKFARDSSGCTQNIAEALSRGDDGEAKRTLHSLKGTASLLGLVDLQRKAEFMESDLSLGEEWHESFKTLSETFEKTMGILKKATPTSNDESHETGEDVSIRDVVERLRPLGRFMARKQPQPILEILDSFGWPEQIAYRLERLKNAVSRYRFDEASPVFDEIINLGDGEKEN